MKSIVSNEYGSIKFNMLGNHPNIHMNVHKWSKDIYRNELYPLAVYAFNYLNALGYEEVYSFTSHESKFERKYQEMFGFTYLTETEEGVVTSRSTSIKDI